MSEKAIKNQPKKKSTKVTLWQSFLCIGLVSKEKWLAVKLIVTVLGRLSNSHYVALLLYGGWSAPKLGNQDHWKVL